MLPSNINTTGQQIKKGKCNYTKENKILIFQKISQKMFLCVITSIHIFVNNKDEFECYLFQASGLDLLMSIQ